MVAQFLLPTGAIVGKQDLVFGALWSVLPLIKTQICLADNNALVLRQSYPVIYSGVSGSIQS